MSPPYHLRRIAIIWLPLFTVGAIFYATTGLHWGIWWLGIIALVGCAILAELTEHPTT